MGRQRHILTEGDSYGDEVDPGEWDAVMDGVLRDQFIRAQIVEGASRGPATVEELAELTGVGTAEVFRHVQRLRATGSLAMTGHRDRSPTYQARGVGFE